MSDLIAEALEQARVADGQRMSDERLAEVFALVKPATGWKRPIQATVPKELATGEEISTAVAWFAGGVPEIEDRGDRWQVTGAGYYVWVGA
jgi:hypothetical protein